MCAYCQTFFAIVVVGENRFEARLVEGVLILLFKICTFSQAIFAAKSSLCLLPNFQFIGGQCFIFGVAHM